MNTYLIVNFDRKEYLRPQAFGESADVKSIVYSYDGVMQGLTVLLADSNNRGGGDLRSDADIIGSWAGQRIAIIDNVVTHAAYCEPGMEHVPLQQQMLALGKDVSAAVIAAIKEGEGDYTILSQLNDRHIVPLPQQRKMSDSARKLFIRDKGWLTPLSKLEHAFEVLGVDAGLTPYMAKRRLQQGLHEMAMLFGVPEPTVTGVSFTFGEKQVVAGFRDQLQTVTGVLSMAISLIDAGAPAEDGSAALTAAREVTVRFTGPQATTTQSLYKELLGVTSFTREPEQTPLGVTSPEVAKLLSMIPNLGA